MAGVWDQIQLFFHYVQIGYDGLSFRDRILLIAIIFACVGFLIYKIYKLFFMILAIPPFFNRLFSWPMVWFSHMD
jgi:hypothetical protein